MEKLQLNNFTLVGHSTGGAISIRYMSRYKGFGVSKLVLVDAAVPVGFTQETAHQLLDQALNDRPKMIRDVSDTFFFQYVTKPFSDWFFHFRITSSRVVYSSHHYDIKR